MAAILFASSSIGGLDDECTPHHDERRHLARDCLAGAPCRCGRSRYHWQETPDQLRESADRRDIERSQYWYFGVEPGRGRRFFLHNFRCLVISDAGGSVEHERIGYPVQVQEPLSTVGAIVSKDRQAQVWLS